MRRPASAALAALLLSLVCAGVGGAESDEAAAAAASGPEEVLRARDALEKPRSPSDEHGVLGEHDPRVREWHASWRTGVEQAWSEAHMCPATWDHLPESKRRILQLVDTTYSGYNYPGSEGVEDRPYVLPLQIPPPAPSHPSPPPQPPSPPPMPPIPPIPPPHPLVVGMAFRTRPGALVDLHVDYRGVGPLFDSVDRYYHGFDRDALNVTNFSAVADPPPHETHSHTQITGAPANATSVFVRLADADGLALSRLAEVPITPGSRLEGQWGPGNTIAVQVRTLWELVSAMRDPSVGRIELQRHVGLRGAPLPAIAAGRDVTVVGRCDNATGPRDVAAASSGSSRRRLTQAVYSSAVKDPYSAYPNAFGDLYGREAQTLIYKHIAEILNLQRFLNETPPFILEEHPDWPVYPAVETLHYAWDEDAYEHSETLYRSFERGTRFDARRPIEYFAAGTTYAFGGDAQAVGPLGGPGMDVPGNVDAATGTYVVPLSNRCVIDGLDTSSLFTVGDADQDDCRWPAPRPARFEPAQGGAVPAAASVASSASRRARRWYDDSSGAWVEETHSFVETATGSFSPWGNDNARTPKPRGPQNPEALGEFRTRARRCGRLSLENLVLRGGWSETGGAAAVVAGGELRMKDCVVEGHRTGVSAGRGGAVANRGGRLDISGCVFRENVAGRGVDGADAGAPDLLAKNPGNNVYHFHSGSLQVDASSRFDGRPWRVDAATEETGA